MRFSTLSSSSSGNCHYIETEETALFVDAGLSGKAVQNHMLAIDADIKNIKGILVTHEHVDHIRGVGILSRRFDLPIFANQGTWEAMEKDLGKIATTNIKTFKTGERIQFGDVEATSFAISHDAKEPVGYVFSKRDKKLSIVTDTGIYTDKIKEAVRGSDLLVMESNHDVNMLEVGPYPYYLKKRIKGMYGHLSNEDCGEFLCDVLEDRKQIILLGHMSKENNFPELAYQTVFNVIKERRHKLLGMIQIELTYRDKPTKVYHI